MGMVRRCQLPPPEPIGRRFGPSFDVGIAFQTVKDGQRTSKDATPQSGREASLLYGGFWFIAPPLRSNELFGALTMIMLPHLVITA